MSFNFFKGQNGLRNREILTVGLPRAALLQRGSDGGIDSSAEVACLKNNSSDRRQRTERK